MKLLPSIEEQFWGAKSSPNTLKLGNSRNKEGWRQFYNLNASDDFKGKKSFY